MRDALRELLPNGSLITPEMLVSLRPEQRKRVAPRLVLTDDGMLRASTKSGLAVSQDEEPKRSRTVAVAIGVLGLAGVALGAAAALRVGPFESPAPQPIASVTTEPKPARPEVVPLPTQVTKSFSLSVYPPSVTVTIDDAPVTVEKGTVRVEGVVGTTRRVRLTDEGRSEETVVAITESGIVPATLGFAPLTQTLPPSTRMRRVSPKSPPPKPGATAQTAPTTAAPAKQPATSL